MWGAGTVVFRTDDFVRGFFGLGAASIVESVNQPACPTFKKNALRQG